MTAKLLNSKIKQSMIRRDLAEYFQVKDVGILNSEEADLLVYVFAESSDVSLSIRVLNAWREKY